jgi:hypothetical protein
MSPLMKIDFRDQEQMKKVVSCNAKIKEGVIKQVDATPAEQKKSEKMERAAKIRAALASKPKVIVGIEGSESWNHVFSAMSYDLEKLKFLVEGFGSDEFKNSAVPYVLKDIQTLCQTYTPESLGTVPVLKEVAGLLVEKCGLKLEECPNIKVILGK